MGGRNRSIPPARERRSQKKEAFFRNNGTPAAATARAETSVIPLGFQPVIGTHVAAKYVEVGDGFTELLTVSTVGAGSWINIAGAPVWLTAAGIPDGPFEDQPTESGFYTWAWGINRVAQGSNGKYIRGSFTHWFGRITETPVTPFQSEAVSKTEARLAVPGDTVQLPRP